MIRSFVLALLSGLLCLLPVWVPALAPLLLVALVPLFWAESQKIHIRDRILSLVVFVLIARLHLWVDPSYLLHFLLLSLALLSFLFVKGQHGAQRGYIAFIFLWTAAMTLPYYFAWDIQTAPPLSLSFMELNYWREIPSSLGFFGAEIWIMVFNVLALHWWKRLRSGRPQTQSIVFATLLIGAGVVGPLIFSQPVEPQPILAKAAQGWTGLPPGDRFAARISFFIAGFLLLFSLVTGYLRRQKAL